MANPSRKANYIAVGVIVAVILAFTAGSILTSRMTNSMTTVKAQDCGDKVMQYINKYLVKQGTSANLVGVNEYNGMYQVLTTYQGQELAIYADSGCTLLFPSIINMSIGTAQPATTAAAPATPMKSVTPFVDIYVMSFCPYGTQAEEALAPVQALLGSKTKMNIRYITSISGTTVNSLHGPEEAKEDLRQLYIQSTSPAVFWKYITGFDTKCYPLVQNLSALGECRDNLMTSLGLDAASIEAASQGNLTLLKADAADVAAKGISGSPTVLINGVLYTGSRAPEAYKEFICNSFTKQPAECSTNLSTVSAAAPGNCG